MIYFYLYIYIHVRVYIYTQTNKYIYIYTYIHIYIYIPRESKYGQRIDLRVSGNFAVTNRTLPPPGVEVAMIRPFRMWILLSKGPSLGIDDMISNPIVILKGCHDCLNLQSYFIVFLCLPPTAAATFSRHIGILLRVTFCYDNFPQKSILTELILCVLAEWKWFVFKTTFGQTACDKLDTFGAQREKQHKNTTRMRGPSVVHAWKSQTLLWKS